MSGIQWLLLALSPLLGGSVVLNFRIKETTWLKRALVFSGAFLFVTCLLHLIPEIVESDIVYAKLFIVLGFFLQMVLEKYSEGIEHGHIHMDMPHGHDHL